LEQHLAVRVKEETTLQESRQKVQTLEHELREMEKSRHDKEQQSQKLNERLQQLRMNWQGDKVRQNTFIEQLSEEGFQLEDVLANMPEEANVSEWDQQHEQIENRMQRLGAINLAAIEECDQLQERSEYLESQNKDLEEALEILLNAIAKIDLETKTRFKDTFDKVNEGFMAIFPKVFGGGKGCLELTSDDLLETGIAVMAQPPGKRNASIHMLSGGEKAMTAIALLFSVFRLNPAPFCVLDEVDAPLDDANVSRYVQLVKEMSETVQVIFISHNKIAIEMAEQLCGVTMHEPGVSRMVSVDIEEAIKMAES
jgi:chromosome segregation protein